MLADETGGHRTIEYSNTPDCRAGYYDEQITIFEFGRAALFSWWRFDKDYVLPTYAIVSTNILSTIESPTLSRVMFAPISRAAGNVRLAGAKAAGNTNQYTRTPRACDRNPEFLFG